MSNSQKYHNSEVHNKDEIAIILTDNQETRSPIFQKQNVCKCTQEEIMLKADEAGSERLENS